MKKQKSSELSVKLQKRLSVMLTIVMLSVVVAVSVVAVRQFAPATENVVPIAENVVPASDNTPAAGSESASAVTSQQTSATDVTEQITDNANYLTTAPRGEQNTSPDGSRKDRHDGDGEKYVYLTFDDGPSSTTYRILDILDRYGIKATFFVVHSGASNEADLLKQIVSRGHAIGLHTYTHDYSQIYASVDAYFADLKQISDYVKSVTGIESKIIRFPGGSSNTVSASYCPGIMTALVSAVSERGYQYFDWNCVDGDADGNCMSAEHIYEKTVSSSNTNSKHLVLLCHDSAAKTTTADALPDIIDYYISNGYKFDVLDESSYPAHHGVNN